MKKNLENRIIELDVFRGVAVLLMIFDHLMYNLWGLMPMLFSDYPTSGGASQRIARAALEYWRMDLRVDIRYVVLAVFMLLTGICCSLSRSNLKRGLKLMAVALLVTAGTYAVGVITENMDITITFGVLHCIALALISVGLLDMVKLSKWVYLAIGIAMTAVGAYLFSGAEFVSYSDAPVIETVWRSILGTATCGGDCFPFLLFGGQVFVGVFAGRQFYTERKSIFKNSRYKNNVVTFVGRNSLAVYILHQIIIPALLGIVLLILGFHLAI
ncbi:MAG: heparan-alpha-glucosaminide N-acetyltransferase domain-containing protein [Bacillota bacterium]|nr:heparan-alpha-glucosaminide N-acetyltransferase domain-containing protein [Bacillota bacterium]